LADNITYFDNLPSFIHSLRRKYGVVDTILDIGCGIRPFGWIKSKQILCVEPFDPYRKVLTSTYGKDGLLAIKTDLLNLTSVVSPSDFNIVSLIDVIEHLPKDVGITSLKKILDEKPKAFLVFTPQGFMPQHAEAEDAWGFNSETQQEHLSGWDIEDFENLGFQEFMIVKDLHCENGKNWNGLLAIYSDKPQHKNNWAIWDPALDPNSPDVSATHIIVIGRHNRFSGSVVGTHLSQFERKIYLPSLSFLPEILRTFYLKLLNIIVTLLNK